MPGEEEGAAAAKAISGVQKPSLTGWQGLGVLDKSRANRPTGPGATCFSCEPSKCKAPLIHTKINLKCKPAQIWTHYDLFPPPQGPFSNLPGDCLAPALISPKIRPPPTPTPSHILLTFLPPKQHPKMPHLVTSQIAMGCFCYPICSCRPCLGEGDMKGVFSRGWGGGGVGSGPLKLFSIGALQLSVLAAEASDCPWSSPLPAAHCALGY